MILKTKTIALKNGTVELLELGGKSIPALGAIVITEKGVVRLLAVNALGLKCAIRKALE